MRRFYADYLQDILDAIQRARAFTGGMTFEEFAEDDRTVYATERALEVIGEAAKRVPEEVRSLAPDVPWRQVAGMRDVVIHQYNRLDLEVIWKAVQEDLPAVEPSIRQALETQRQREQD
jgi:uncharacterized protein with HEPN domain